MVNGIRTIYPHKLNKGFNSKFCIGSWVQHYTPEEGQRKYWPKRCVYNNEDEDNSPNIMNDNNFSFIFLSMTTGLGEGKLNSNLLSSA